MVTMPQSRTALLLGLALVLCEVPSAHAGEPNLVALKIERTEVVGGIIPSVIGTVYLDAPAQRDLSIQLIQSPAFTASGTTNCFSADEVQQPHHPVAARAPDAVRIAAGQREGSFKIETYLVEDVPRQVVTFKAAYKDISQSATLTLTQWSISSFKVVRNPPGAAAPYTANFTLSAPAPFDLMIFLERPDGRRLHTPDGTTIFQRLPRGSSSTTIAVYGSDVCDGGTAARIVADPGCRSILGRAETGIECEPPPGLSYISINPQIVVSGSSAQGEVGLFGPTPVPVQVTLTTDKSNIQIPASVTVPAGQSKAVFQIGTTGLRPGDTQVDAIIRADYQRHESQVIRILPPPK